MTNPIEQDLGGVVRLLEKLDDGLWREHPAMDYSICLPDETYIDIARTHGKSEAAERDAIVAAVNFLRANSAEIAGALRDAERYRWLRQNPNGTRFRVPCPDSIQGCKVGHRGPHLLGDDLDAAIDSAMQQGGGGGDHA